MRRWRSLAGEGGSAGEDQRRRVVDASVFGLNTNRCSDSSGSVERVCLVFVRSGQILGTNKIWRGCVDEQLRSTAGGESQSERNYSSSRRQEVWMSVIRCK